MADAENITVENRLIHEKRAISVYHQASRGAHLISQNGSVIISLKPEVEEDYLHISVITGPGRLRNDCVLEIPGGLDFEFEGEGKVMVAHKRGWLMVRIPAGPPVWQLKITRPTGLPGGNGGGPSAFTAQRITIRELERIGYGI
jgi:hypothetical protein